MKTRINIKSRFSKVPLVRIAIFGAFIGWLLLSTVTPVPAPPPGDGTIPPG